MAWGQAIWPSSPRLRNGNTVATIRRSIPGLPGGQAVVGIYQAVRRHDEGPPNQSLAITDDANALTHAIISAGILPPQVVRDAAHVAVAAVHAIDYLLTWNCKHLANAQIARRIAVVCEKAGQKMPIICTPDELMGD